VTRNSLTLYLLGLAVALLAGCQSAPTPTRHVAVSMRKYAITPAEIRLKAGETVQFEVVTEDVQHGFSVPDLGINEPVNPGRPAVFLYRAAKQGSFFVECGILCGSGHDAMRARIVIE
jgi:cytochrome c oxidase subunit II